MTTLINHEDHYSWIILDKKIYSISAVQKTAYRFGNRVLVLIEHHDRELIKVNFKMHSLSQNEIEHLVHDFINDLNDQCLRNTISQETSTIKNLLLAQAFSKTSLVDTIGENDNYENDTADIKKWK